VTILPHRLKKGQAKLQDDIVLKLQTTLQKIMNYPTELNHLIAFLRKLPGVGAKTAERFAFQLLSWKSTEHHELSSLLATLKERITSCSECHALMSKEKCSFCDLDKRDPHLLCIVASSKDVFAIEETRSYQGLYHVIGGLLSPIEGRTADHLMIHQLKNRLDKLPIKEVILALDSTLEGDTTALYLKQQLSQWGVTVSRLAFGLPMGSSLDYVDGGTLSRAFTGRQQF
jgi:recombination protein RecR